VISVLQAFLKVSRIANLKNIQFIGVLKFWFITAMWSRLIFGQLRLRGAVIIMAVLAPATAPILKKINFKF